MSDGSKELKLYFLPCQNTLTHSICNDAAITPGIECQQRLQLCHNFPAAELWNTQLRAKQVVSGDDLTVKCRIERSGPHALDVCGRVNIHAINLRVREESSAVIKNWALSLCSVLLQQRNIVQVTILIEIQRVDFNLYG